MGNSLTKLINDYSFSLRGTSSPAVKTRHNKEQSERAKLANAMAYLSVTGSLLFRHDRCHISRARYFFAGMTEENSYNEMMCFFVTQFIKPDTSPAKAVAWIDMNLPRINVSRSNQMKIHDVVETDDEPRSSEKCVTYHDWFIGEMEAMEEELMRGDAVEVVERFGLGTTAARPMPAIMDDFNVDRNDVALPVLNEIKLLPNCSPIYSSSITQCVTDQDELIPVYYASPLWPLIPQKDTPQKGFVLPFGPLKEHRLDYLEEMALDYLDKYKPIPYPPPSLLNLENGEFIQLKPSYDVSFAVSPTNDISVGRGKSYLQDQGHDEDAVVTTVQKDICQNIDSPTIHVSATTSEMKSCNVHLEPTNQLYQLAMEVRQSLTNEEAPANYTLLVSPAANDAMPHVYVRVDQNNNAIENRLREFSQSDLKTGKVQLISSLSTADISPRLQQTLDNEPSDVNGIQKLVTEVREEIHRASTASLQQPLELISSSYPNLDHDQELFEENVCFTRKPANAKESHTPFKSRNRTRSSSDETELEIPPEETSETSIGSAFTSSSGDSGVRGPVAGRRASGDITCRPGYRGIHHEFTPTSRTQRVFRSCGHAPSQLSSPERPLIGPLPPAYPCYEYKRSGYRGFSRY